MACSSFFLVLFLSLSRDSEGTGSFSIYFYSSGGIHYMEPAKSMEKHV